MKRLIVILLVVVFALSGCHSPSLPADGTAVQTEAVKQQSDNIDSEQEEAMNIIGYIPTWEYDFCLEDYDWTRLTHVNIAFLNPTSEGEFISPMSADDLHKVVAMAHENGVMVLFSLGGWGGSVNYPKLVADGNARARLNQNLLDIVKEFDIDGIDLDIEGDVDGTFWDYYDTWVGELKELCGENSLLFTTAVGMWYSQHISDYALSQFDLVNMMAYDAGGENHSSYEFALDNIEYYLARGVDGKKLVLGVPFYGRNADFGGMDYDKIIEADSDNFYREEYDGYVYNNADMIARKCELAKMYGGIMIWELSADAQGEYSLLDIIFNCK